MRGSFSGPPVAIHRLIQLLKRDGRLSDRSGGVGEGKGNREMKGGNEGGVEM